MNNGFGILGNLCVAAKANVNTAAAAFTAPYVPMNLVDTLTLVILFGAGTAGEDPVITFKQAKDSSGTSVKNVAVRRVFYRSAADIDGVRTAMSRVGSESSPIESVDTATLDGGENEMIFCVEVRAQDLDHANGFNHFTFSVADTGTNAKQMSALYLSDSAYYASIPG